MSSSGVLGRYPARAVENALAHVNPDKTEAAYERTDQLALRRGLMQDWAQHCTAATSQSPSQA